MQSFRFLFLLIIPLIIPDSNLFAIIRHVPDEYSTIQMGISASMDDDTVLVAPGTYTRFGNQNINFYGKAILVTSEAGPDSTIIERWDESGFIFQNDESSLSILDGFTINNFDHGISIVTASPIVKNCKISECGFWGGVGGGIYMHLSNPIIEHCTFSFCFNDQGLGSAIYASSSNPTILNSLFYINQDFFGFGVILCGEATFTNCTFYGNWPHAIQGSPDVINCVFWFNGDDIVGDANVSYSNLEDYWPGESNIFGDPLFINEENFDFRLSAASPCIDLGDPDSPNIPWGGFRRDMGAFEYDQGFYFDGQNTILKPFPIGIPLLLSE